MLAVGIDTGVNTGIAIWDLRKKRFTLIKSMKIHKAMELIHHIREEIHIVRVEDARKRKWYANNSKEVLQGVGSVKRDAKIWEDYLKDLAVNYEMIHPIKGGTKTNADFFKQIANWEQPTNEHSRDAAMMVFNL